MLFFFVLGGYSVLFPSGVIVLASYCPWGGLFYIISLRSELCWGENPVLFPSGVILLGGYCPWGSSCSVLFYSGAILLGV